jgi:hypothetical protein
MSDPTVFERVVATEDSFGTVLQLWRGSVLVDTYCSWNGDCVPNWVPAHIDGSDDG